MYTVGYWHAGKLAPVYYYRDADQREVDLLIAEDGEICPVEIKKTTAPTRNDIRHFSALGKLDLPLGRGAVLCMSGSPMPITETVDAFPVSSI